LLAIVPARPQRARDAAEPAMVGADVAQRPPSASV